MAPATPDDLFARFDALGVAHTTIHHPPVFTVEAAQQHREGIDGGFSKNLFLRNHKKKMWLVVAQEARPIDLKRLGALLEAGRFSFASERRLAEFLGVVPGAVTPFAVMNDASGAVQVVVDEALFHYERVWFHPLDNARTTGVSPADLRRFLEAVGHPPQIVDLTAAAPEP